MPKPSPEELAAFAKHVAAFIPTTPDELLQLIDSQETAIVFLGKPSCSYCRRFVAKLSRQNKIRLQFQIIRRRN